MNDQPAFTFTSHIAGRNAKVKIYPTHIEWQAASVRTVNAIILAIFTIGLSLLARNLRPGAKGASEMIPMKAVSSVTTKPKLTQTELTIICSGNSIVANISAEEAAEVKSFILGRLV